MRPARAVPALLTTILTAALALPAGAAPRQDKVVHAKDSGKTVTLAVGAKLTVRLRECAPCGYYWKTSVAPAKAILRRTSSTYVDPPPSPAIGGPGTRVLVYRAKQAGSTSIGLVYRGPDGSKAGTFTLRVKVKP
jgi:predicted secreted protein